MKKKYILTLMAVLNITAFAATPVFASNYIIDPAGYDGGVHNEKWERSEVEAELKAWSNARKDAILSIQGETERYNAVVNAVCDFMTYDTKYGMASTLYTMQDGKGVCTDYTVLTKALCDAVGIKCEVASGIFQNYGHTWCIVTLDGVEYYSDTTNVDAGVESYRLSQSLWGGYELRAKYSTLTESVKLTGLFINDNIERSIHAPAGMVPLTGKSGKIYYVTQKESDDLANGIIPMRDIIVKYGID